MLNFIVNTRSGRGRGFKNLQKIIRYCHKNSVEYTVHITSAPGHATRIARALVDNQSSTIVAVGGDGTFHEVLNGIYSFEKTALGFIPSGKGNDYASCARISTNPIEALKHIIRGEIIHTDYIQVGDIKCLNVAGTGLDVDVLERVADKRGKLTYLKSLLYCLKHFEPYDIEVTVDGETKAYNCVMIGICNGSSIGGNIRISPASRIDDGSLNAVILRMPSNGKILSTLRKVVKGKHMLLPVTTHFLCEEVSIKVLQPHPIQLDGEIYHDLSFDCKVVKHGLKTFSTFKKP